MWPRWRINKAPHAPARARIPLLPSSPGGVLQDGAAWGATADYTHVRHREEMSIFPPDTRHGILSTNLRISKYSPRVAPIVSTSGLSAPQRSHHTRLFSTSQLTKQHKKYTAAHGQSHHTPARRGALPKLGLLPAQTHHSRYDHSDSHHISAVALHLRYYKHEVRRRTYSTKTVKTPHSTKDLLICT